MVVDVLYNPHVRGHAFLVPQHTVVRAVYGDIKKLGTIFQDALFLRDFQATIPTKAKPYMMLNFHDYARLKIQAIDSTSSRICLRGLKFQCRSIAGTSYSVTCVQDDQFKSGTTPGRILAKEGMRSIAWLIVHVTLAILCFPLSALGCTVKATSLAFHSPRCRTLHVDVTTRAEWEMLRKEARQWQKLALYKQKAHDQEELFDSASRIAKLVAECLESPLLCGDIFDRALVCRDDQNQIQAIALTHETEQFAVEGTLKTFLKIAHLVTHPHNIRSKVNEREFERVEGAGSALVRHIARESVARRLAGVYAEVTATAKRFYEKRGFEVITRDQLEMLEPNETPMVLRAAKIA